MKNLNEQERKLLQDFCQAQIQSSDFIMHTGDDGIYALRERTGINTHDGYEYSVGSSCRILRITAEKFEAEMKHRDRYTNAYGMSRFASLRSELFLKTTNYYLVECSQSNTESVLDAYANGFLGLEGYFHICVKHWNTI